MVARKDAQGIVRSVVGDVEMASMRRGGRLVIFLMRAVTLWMMERLKAESRED